MLQGTALHAEGRAPARDLVDADGWVSLRVAEELHVVHVPQHLKESCSIFMPNEMRSMCEEDLTHMRQWLIADGRRDVARVQESKVLDDPANGGKPGITD